MFSSWTCLSVFITMFVLCIYVCVYACMYGGFLKGGAPNHNLLVGFSIKTHPAIGVFPCIYNRHPDVMLVQLRLGFSCYCNVSPTPEPVEKTEKNKICVGNLGITPLSLSCLWGILLRLEIITVIQYI